jgi:hypothetical protein
MFGKETEVRQGRFPGSGGRLGSSYLIPGEADRTKLGRLL